MNRIGAMVPPPLEQEIENYQEEQEYDNKSQAIRELLRSGLENERVTPHSVRGTREGTDAD